jgi:hypothetical protein
VGDYKEKYSLLEKEAGEIKTGVPEGPEAERYA